MGKGIAGILSGLVLFGGSQGQNCVPDGISAPAGFGRKQDHIFFFHRQGPDDGVLLLDYFCFGKLVCFGEDQYSGNRKMRQPADEILFFLPGQAPDVHDDDHPFQRLAGGKVGFNHGAPFFPDGYRDPGIAIAGQIDKNKVVINVEKVDQLGAPRGGTGFYQVLAVDQGVDQAGFADIRAAGKGNLRQTLRRVLRRFDRAGDKFGRFDDHVLDLWLPAAGLWLPAIDYRSLLFRSWASVNGYTAFQK